MSDLESLMEARDTYKRYITTMHRLIGTMVACWLAEVPLILYAPIMLTVAVPGAVTAGIVAWWTYYDAHHGPIGTQKNDYNRLVQYRPTIPGPRAALAAAEANYRRTL